MSLKGAHRPPTAAKPKKHRLEGIDDVILYTTQQANPVAFLYELECARFSRVDFTLDFSGSSNFYVELADGTPAAGAGGAGARGGGGGKASGPAASSSTMSSSSGSAAGSSSATMSSSSTSIGLIPRRGGGETLALAAPPSVHAGCEGTRRPPN